MLQIRPGLIGFFFLLCAPQVAVSQAVPQSTEISPSGQEYLRAIRARGVQSDVRYFDPTAPAPALETRETPSPRSDTSGSSGFGRLDAPATVIALLILGAVIATFLRFGGSSRLALSKNITNAERRGRAGSSDLPQDTVDTPDLAAILKNPDRKAALIALAQLLMSRGIAANGLLLQRSWTARDVLRRIPQDQSYRQELQELILMGERVHFGDHPVSAADFDGFLSRARPVLKALSR